MIDWTLAPPWAKYASRRPSGHIRWHENKPSEYDFHFWDEVGKNLDDQTQIFPILQRRVEIKPTYYHQGQYEVLYIIEKYQVGFTIGNIIKYIARAEYKGQKKDDIKKAIQYADRHLNKYGNISSFIPEDEADDIADGWGLSGRLASSFMYLCKGDLRSAIFYLEEELYSDNEKTD
jgi:hypothetical protein